jgi:hypothetical protein
MEAGNGLSLKIHPQRLMTQRVGEEGGPGRRKINQEAEAVAQEH